MSYDEVLDTMRALHEMETRLARSQEAWEEQIRAYRTLQEGERRLIEGECRELARKLETWMRAYSEKGGKRFKCALGELRLTQVRKWSFGLSPKETAAELLALGYYHALKISLKRSVLESLSPLILAELQITRPTRQAFTYKLGRAS